MTKTLPDDANTATWEAVPKGLIAKHLRAASSGDK